jgi:arylformamidase
MNAQALERLGAPARFAYGNAAIEALDLYRTDQSRAPIHIFLHGGTWRTGMAQNFAYIAEPFVQAGAHVVIPDFASVEMVADGLSELVRQVRDAVAWAYVHAAEFDGDRDRIFISGHSSGGHLAGAVLTTDWRGGHDLPADLVKGGLCISGMFDLRPVRLSWRNSYLNLTDASEQSLSPMRHIAQLTAPLVVAYGTEETPEFQRQSREFAAAVHAAGKTVELLTAPGYNHFEILSTLGNPYGILGRAALAQMGLV